MDNLITDDKYAVWIPIEDHDLMKSIEVDENGDYIVQGVISSDDKDEESDSITPAGMDCSYFLTKGWVKYEHGKEPRQFIGEPLDIKVGQFQHPTLKKSVNGVYIKARLFQSRELTQQAVKAIGDLQKSNTTRRMGWSIEGNVKERDRTTGKVKKSILRNVVLTMNPVNTMTWAELQKSFAPDHELTVDCEDLDKSMDTGACAEITPQSVEGVKPEKQPEEEEQKRSKALHNTFRGFLKKLLTVNSLRKSFISSSKDNQELMMYSFCVHRGLGNSEATELASYIADRCDIVKSLLISGGVKMAGTEEVLGKSLLAMLDEDLENLQKAISEDEDKEGAEGSEGGDDNEDDEGAEGSEDGDGDEDEGAEGSEDGDGDEDEGGDGKSQLRKSIETDENMEKALEVSDFLSSLVDEIGFGQEGLEKSMMKVSQNQDVLIKSITSMIGVVKDQQATIAGLNGQVEDLQKSLNAVIERPVGRRGVTSQTELTTLSKSMETQSNAGGHKPVRLSRPQISAVLMKSFEMNEISGSVVSRFEAGVPLANLNLPTNVQDRLGM